METREAPAPPPESTGIDPNTPVRRSWYRRIGGWLLAHLPWILLVLALVAAGVFAFLWQNTESVERRRDEVERAARRFVTQLTTFSSDTILDDVEAIERFAAPGSEFEGEVNVFFGQEAVAAIQEAEAKSEGQIRSIFVQALDDGRASVFAVVDETVTNTDLADPRTDTLRMTVDMIEVDGGWKVANVDVLQSPGSTLVPSAPGG